MLPSTPTALMAGRQVHEAQSTLCVAYAHSTTDGTINNAKRNGGSCVTGARPPSIRTKQHSVHAWFAPLFHQ